MPDESNTTEQRIRFLTNQDWHNYIAEARANGHEVTSSDHQSLRRDCYKEIEEKRGRPLLIYATQFVGVLNPKIPNNIDLSDVDGFTDLVNSIPTEIDKIDVLLHSPGGNPDATERIVSILRGRFSDITFLVPHSAYSAATMLALSGNKIILHPSAVLGPIDPQIDGIPARSIKRGFDKVKDKIAEEGAETLAAYIPLIEKYTIHLLEICEDSERLSKDLVTDWLTKYMLNGESDEQIEEIVNFFSDYDQHLLHARPLSIDKIEALETNLKIERADDELAPLLWEAYILLNSFFEATPFVKLYENSDNLSWGKQFQQIMLPNPPANVPPQQKQPQQE